MAPGMSPVSVCGLLFCLPFALGTTEWDWAGTFDLPAGHYTWSCTKAASGRYAEATSKILIYSLTDSSAESLAAAQSDAETEWISSTSVESYGELEAGSTYTLQFDEDTWTTHFKIHIVTAGAYAVMFEHSPYAFENGFHYLRSKAGEDIEPVHEEKYYSTGLPEDEERCPWTMEWEWSGIFPVEEGWYDWNAEKVDGAYPDARMKIVIIATNQTDIRDLEADAQTYWDAITVSDEVVVGETIPLGSGTTLHFDVDTWASHFKIQVPVGTSYVAVFAEHFPIEFEDSYHFLKDASAVDIEPVAEESVSGCADKGTASTGSSDLGEVILASIITVLPTMAGIVLIAMMCMERAKTMLNEEGTFQSSMHSFASGVIFAAAVFLLLPEGLYLLAVGKTEAGGAAAWGTSLMGGWTTCILIKHVCQLVAGEKSATGEEKPEQEGTPRISWAVSFPILFGDAFHNFADGLVLGVAFKTCGSSFGWKLTWITVLHELPQEISDFAVLITKGRMWWPMAAALNFASGLTTVVGAIITNSTAISQGVEGAILAAGAGVYLYVAVTELGPEVGDLRQDRALGSVARVLSFAAGAALIGLVLLDHEHCYAPVAEGAEAGASSGHAHGH
ncbi:unnamed protein product [Prorocentrum cordatum]|uniref:Uncharacterized protein n=1 Tax=Prorocentrum cordatum TaxID=2364126 RepID=A0ABN9Y1V9_9DINO|nr:unnamed protein product [Polarella glacialis]